MTTYLDESRVLEIVQLPKKCKKKKKLATEIHISSSFSLQSLVSVLA